MTGWWRETLLWSLIALWRLLEGNREQGDLSRDLSPQTSTRPSVRGAGFPCGPVDLFLLCSVFDFLLSPSLQRHGFHRVRGHDVRVHHRPAGVAPHRDDILLQENSSSRGGGAKGSCVSVCCHIHKMCARDWICLCR